MSVLVGMLGRLLCVSRASAAAASFNAADYGTVLAWYDAQDAATLWQDDQRTTLVDANGQNIEAWDDKSGNAQHVKNTTAGSFPTFLSSGVGGKGSVKFLSSFLTTSGMVDPGDSLTIFTVINPTIFAGTYVNYTDSASFANGLEAKVDWTWNPITRLKVDTGTMQSIANPTYAGGVDHIVVFQNDPANNKKNLWVDGAVEDGSGYAHTTLGSTLTNLTLGDRIDLLKPAKINVGEIVIYEGTMSQANIDGVNTDLATKWDITLP